MTNEEAIKGLEGLSRAFGGYKPNEEMFEMAIAALKAEPCEDAISRPEVLNQIFYSTDNSGDVVLGSTLRHRIEKLPPVTPKQRTGKWELTDDEQNYRCSCCKNHWISASEYFDVWKYCPNCGAKMEGE